MYIPFLLKNISYLHLRKRITATPIQHLYMIKKKRKVTSKPIDLRHSIKEWRIIEKRIDELKKEKRIIEVKQTKRKTQKEREEEQSKILHRHIRNKMYLLANDFKECPDCIFESLLENDKVVKRHHIPLELYNTFNKISKKSKIPITTLVEKLIISPLLIEK